MKKFFLLMWFLASMPMFSQTDSLQVYQTRKNIVKLNATALIFRNVQFQYERVLSKRVSAALTYSFIPQGDVPFKDQITGDTAADFEGDVDPFEQAEIKYSSFTPEVRFYLGKKGYGKGFYLAPFFRSSKYEFDKITVSYELDNGSSRVIDFAGDLKSNTFGLLVGAQFNIGNSFVLDWWIAGPHYGTGKGSLTGISSDTLSAEEQQSLSQELEDIDPPVIDLEYEVNSNGAKIKAAGPWGGIRGGLAIAFRF